MRTIYDSDGNSPRDGEPMRGEPTRHFHHNEDGPRGVLICYIEQAPEMRDLEEVRAGRISPEPGSNTMRVIAQELINLRNAVYQHELIEQEEREYARRVVDPDRKITILTDESLEYALEHPRLVDLRAVHDMARELVRLRALLGIKTDNVYSTHLYTQTLVDVMDGTAYAGAVPLSLTLSPEETTRLALDKDVSSIRAWLLISLDGRSMRAVTGDEYLNRFGALPPNYAFTDVAGERTVPADNPDRGWMSLGELSDAVARKAATIDKLGGWVKAAAMGRAAAAEQAAIRDDVKSVMPDAPLNADAMAAEVKAKADQLNPAAKATKLETNAGIATYLRQLADRIEPPKEAGT